MLVELLIDKGAKLEAKDKASTNAIYCHLLIFFGLLQNGTTPILSCTATDRLYLLTMMISKGCDIHAKNDVVSTCVKITLVTMTCRLDLERWQQLVPEEKSKWQENFFK